MRYAYVPVRRAYRVADGFRKYEHSKTFGIVTSGTSNTLWTPDENGGTSATRTSGAGRAIVGADEEVLCWDLKKGELLSRWKDNACNSEVTTIAQSEADPDIYAVGCGIHISNYNSSCR